MVRGSGPTLLGRNWLEHLTLDWIHIKAVQLEKDSLRQLLFEYAGIFVDELGTITPMKAKPAVSPSAVPKGARQVGEGCGAGEG